MIYGVHDGVSITPSLPVRMLPRRTGLVGRPRIWPDRRAYKTAKQREYRQRQKEGK